MADASRGRIRDLMNNLSIECDRLVAESCKKVWSGPTSPTSLSSPRLECDRLVADSCRKAWSMPTSPPSLRNARPPTIPTPTVKLGDFATDLLCDLESPRLERDPKSTSKPLSAEVNPSLAFPPDATQATLSDDDDEDTPRKRLRLSTDSFSLERIDTFVDPDFRDLPSAPGEILEDLDDYEAPPKRRANARISEWMMNEDIEKTKLETTSKVFGEESRALKRRIKKVQAESRMRMVERSVLSSMHKVATRRAAYKDHGIPAWVATSRQFEVITLIVISINALWLWIDTDYNKATDPSKAHWGFTMVENIFCFYFTMEVVIRFLAFRRKLDGLCDLWFLFDVVLVFLMVLETWILPVMVVLARGNEGIGVNASLFRLLRLIRLSRLTRMMRALPELLFLLKGIATATRSVSCVVFLLGSILYVFGIIMVQLSADTAIEHLFLTVPDAMLTLFIQVTLLDNIDELIREVQEASTICFIMLFFVIVLGAMTMMNMLVGILCEVVSSVAKYEREAMATSFIKEKVISTLGDLDADGDNQISKEEFVAIIEHPLAVDALTEAGVDVVGMVDIADFIFQSDREGAEFNETLDVDSFMAIVMKFCGTNYATVKDIVDLRKLGQAQSASMHDALHRVMANQKVIADKMKRYFDHSKANQAELKVALQGQR